MVTVPTQAQEFQRLPLRLAYTFLKENGLANEAAEIKASQDRVGNWVSSLRSAKILVLLRRENLLDKFIEMHWRFAKSPAGIKKLKMVRRTLFQIQNVWHIQSPAGRRDRSWDAVRSRSAPT